MKKILFFSIFFILFFCYGLSSETVYNAQDYEIIYPEKIICLKESISENGATYILVYLRYKELKIEPYFIDYSSVKISVDGRTWLLMKKADGMNKQKIVEIHLASSKDIEFK